MRLRQQKKENTRAALADATIRLALADGFDGFTVDQVAEIAGVSRRTFFRYFDTKEAAFFAEHETRFEAFSDALQARLPGETAYDTVRRCLLDMAREYDNNRAELTARHFTIEDSRALLAYDLAMDRRFEYAIIEALRDNEMDVLRARVLGSAVFGVVRAVLRPWFQEPISEPLVDLGRRALDLLEVGFRSDRGQVVQFPEWS